jgi:hypothetical protein
MHSFNITALMRTPPMRRLGAWLMILAIGVHAVLLAAHQPAAAAGLPDPMTALCITSGETLPGAGPHSDSESAPAHRMWLCPICQTLHAGAPLPVSIASVDAPLLPDGGPVAISAPATAFALATGDLHPRGPPHSV